MSRSIEFTLHPERVCKRNRCLGVPHEYLNLIERDTLYRSGELDVTYDIPLNQNDPLTAELGDQVRIAISTEVTYYSFNLIKPPFDNIDLRRALTLAIDREVLQGKIVKGGAIPSYSYAGRIDPDYKGPLIAEATMSQADCEVLARELYAKAGFGPDNVLHLAITSTVAEDHVRLAQGVALMWKKVLGAEATVIKMEVKAWLDTFHAGGWDVFGDNVIGVFSGPETYLSYMRPSAKSGYNWVKPEYDAAMDVAAAISDKASRYRELAKAEKIFLDDYVVSPIAVEPLRHLVSPHVKGWGKSVIGYHNSQRMTLE